MATIDCTQEMTECHVCSDIGIMYSGERYRSNVCPMCHGAGMITVELFNRKQMEHAMFDHDKELKNEVLRKITMMPAPLLEKVLVRIEELWSENL